MQLLVNIDVDDLERAVGFYCAAFALRVGRRFGDGGVELLGAPVPIYLLAQPAGSAPAPGTDCRRDYRRHWTPVHLDVVVDALEPAVERALRAGAVLETTPQSRAWGRIATFSDPFGNGFCLLQFVGRGYDAIAMPAVPQAGTDHGTP
jgi:predicted enzyme related to lactoylglutathione lyase